MTDTPCPTCGSLRPRGTRFYARVRSAVLECPACGWPMVMGSRGKRGRDRRQVFDVRASVLTCPGCERAFVIGLLAWPIDRHQGRALPHDQVANQDQARQLAKMRRRADGHWLEERKTPMRAEETNLTGKVCTCPEHRRSLACEIHGPMRV